jgi:ketosteroid isomerase-like protein
MKSFKILSILFLSFFFISSTFAANKLSDKDKAAVKKTIQEFVTNLDKGNVNGVKSTISDKSTFVQVNGITNKSTQYTSDDYLSAIKDRSIGGWERQLEIMDVNAAGNTAMAKIQTKDPRTTSTGFVTLLKENNNWKIISCTLFMELNQK